MMTLSKCRWPMTVRAYPWNTTLPPAFAKPFASHDKRTCEKAAVFGAICNFLSPPLCRRSYRTLPYPAKRRAACHLTLEGRQQGLYGLDLENIEHPESLSSPFCFLRSAHLARQHSFLGTTKGL